MVFHPLSLAEVGLRLRSGEVTLDPVIAQNIRLGADLGDHRHQALTDL